MVGIAPRSCGLRADEDAPDEWEEDAPQDIGLLTRARLRVLARQGRSDEYLNLARAAGRAAGQTVAYTTLRARLGRGAEAEAYGRAYLATAGEALDLAQALAAAGEHERAMGIADHGLTLETTLYGWDGIQTAGIGGYAVGGSRAQLAAWLRDEALAHGQHERALRAAERAFREDASLAAYLRAEEVAGECWADVRPDLIDHLRTVKSATDQGRFDVFLHEGLVEDAITVIHADTFAELVARVRPEWGSRRRGSARSRPWTRAGRLTMMTRRAGSGGRATRIARPTARVSGARTETTCWRSTGAKTSWCQ